MHVRHPLRSVRALFSSKWFAIGMLVAAGSWSLHVAALALAPMSVVQVSLAGGVVLIAVMADRMFGFQVGPRQWLGLCADGGGPGAAGRSRCRRCTGPHSPFSTPAMISFEAGLFGLGATADHGSAHGRASAEHHGMMLGAAAGILFGVSDTSIKALTGIVGAHGVLGLLLSPWLAVAVLASIVAFFASARGLQDGETRCR